MPDTVPEPTPGPDPSVVGDLLPEATRRLVRSADSLAEDQYAEPSGLPGWTRAHVLSHLALNAEALAGVLAGIVEGRPVPMYASQEARDSGVELLAAEPAEEVRGRLLGGCTALSDAIAAVPPDRWGTTVDRTPGGRTFQASAVPAMRLVEVEIHHVDLATGYGRHEWDPAFVAHVLDAMLTRASTSTSFSVYAADLDRTWVYGEGGPTVSGSGADLAWWLTGRGDGEGLTSDDGALPQVGAW